MKARAEKAEADLEAVQRSADYWARQTNGVAMLRRLREWVDKELVDRHAQSGWLHGAKLAREHVLKEIDRLIAEAEIARQKTLADDMGEPASGIAMLRKLREEFQRERESKLREANYARDDAKCDAYEDAMRGQATLIGDLMGHIDHAIAEAEKPAKLKRCERCHWPLADDAKDGCVPGNCSKRPLPKPAENRTTDPTDGEDSHREADDVLRRWLGKVRDGDGCIDLQADAVAELCRRALGEGGGLGEA